VRAASGDFLRDPLPRADVLTIGMIFHDWNLEKKRRLVTAAYEALPPARRDTRLLRGGSAATRAHASTPGWSRVPPAAHVRARAVRVLRRPSGADPPAQRRPRRRAGLRSTAVPDDLLLPRGLRAAARRRVRGLGARDRAAVPALPPGWRR
jgi:hypothetical protein